MPFFFRAADPKTAVGTTFQVKIWSGPMLDAEDKAQNVKDFSGQTIEEAIALVQRLDDMLSSPEAGAIPTDHDADSLAICLIECAVRLFDKRHDRFVENETEELRLTLKRFSDIRSSISKRRTARLKKRSKTKHADPEKSAETGKQEAQVEVAHGGTKPATDGATPDPKSKAELESNPDQNQHAVETKSELAKSAGFLRRLTLFALLVVLTGTIAAAVGSMLTQQKQFVGLSAAMSQVLTGSGLIEPNPPLPLGAGLIFHYENGTITRCEVRPKN
jgi:hypothetical protein